MSVPVLERLLVEFRSLGTTSADPGLEALGRAMVLEDVLGITLTDEQIVGDPMSSPDIVEGLLPDQRSPA